MDKKDQALLDRARNGDNTAFRELVKKYESTVAAAVYGMLGRCPAADDVGQETFIRFYQSMHRFRGDARISTYLTRIAINLSLNELKRRKRKFSLFVSDTAEKPMDIPDTSITEYDGEKELVHAAVQKLDLKFRTVVVLRIMEGYSTRETAEILGLPQGTVLSRLARAQKKLKELLTPFIGEQYEKERPKTAASGF